MADLACTGAAPDVADRAGSVRPRRGLGLAARLVLIGVLAALLVSVVAGYVLREQLHRSVKEAFAERLQARVDRIVARLVVADAGVIAQEPALGDDFARIFSGWYWLLDGPGVSLRSRSLWDGDISQRHEDHGAITAVGPQGEALRGVIHPLVFADQALQLTIFGPSDTLDLELSRFDQVLFSVVLSLLLVLSLTSVLQVRLGLRPLGRLQQALGDVEQGTRERIGTGYGPDLDPLAAEMDTMFQRNAAMVQRARGHAADLAHALKKPLAILMGASAAPLEGVPSALVREQARAMHRLSERHLARMGSGAGERRRVEVRSRLDSLIGLMRQLHGERGIAWRVDSAVTLFWRGEATDLEEMLGNLLDNAGKWAGRQVVVQARRDGGDLLVEIEDDGPGLSPEQLARVAERGRRFDESVEGTGLGLAITADIAETYGGDLTFGRSRLGGLRVALSLPA